MSNFFKATPKSYKLLSYFSGLFCLIFYVIGLFVAEKANPYLLISFVLAVIYGYCLWQVDEKEELLSDWSKNIENKDRKKYPSIKEWVMNKIKKDAINNFEKEIMKKFSQKVPKKHELKAMRKRDDKGRFV